MSGPPDDSVPGTYASTRVATAGPAPTPVNPSWPEAGELIDDFELQQLLGQGAFGRVFLARQISLGREVALKVTRRACAEARTLAHLEHDHIVRVFSEVAVPDRGWWLLCMQYVSGTTLQQIIESFEKEDPTFGSGQEVLVAVDTLSQGPALFDPVALREREALETADYADAACRIGERLAVALAYAHHRGIFHRDIKPANILVSRYGRPMLVDFNVASDLRAERAGVGGTVHYMAPEHIDALNPCCDTPAQAVDARSDVYSLGLVLFELIAGQPAFDRTLRGEDAIDTYDKMAAQRRGPAPFLADVRPGTPVILDRTIRRALAGNPNERYPTAGDFAHALAGARLLHQVDRRVPMPWFIEWTVIRHPVLTLLAMAFVPHLIGSAVNIAYNAQRIVAGLTEEQQTAFLQVAGIYNLIVYSASLCVVVCWVRPVARTWRRINQGADVTPAESAAARCRALRWPKAAGWLATLGWLPGGILFPLMIHLLRGPIPMSTAGHFIVSFALSGLVALTYSMLGVQYAVVRGLYRNLWPDGRGAPQAVPAELQGIDRRLAWLQVLAGSIPLVGAALLLSVGPETQITFGFRMLVVGLIALGMAGFSAAIAVRDRLSAVLDALRGNTRT
ncbi:MAG: serine/threonine protein kinase [Gemmataceae bacterium]|nr:serine/threonine protein kinase [Gemmataceae bacterium]